ncbi:rac serine-threonine kinase, putative [Trypanosoma equiperdum]|uniref:Rac serine-threonine kinase, putative n=2 Tax=Trypanozoon TaxID=39700 RepID=Q584T1_TRYB2|nr:rac serine-threonine kinase, putative [Trypanosoma brucei brucei TREU927]AAX80858.1 rac serine-threonine kinase, putative [Trypanosoma brucei]AAZ11787.1 rac serine-threonine kinase, putative [Trypanosoma brucei brucei TREU927]SCU71901.1 rac serine-threonine kinase, putative [Trypanosoma equiperdum]
MTIDYSGFLDEPSGASSEVTASRYFEIRGSILYCWTYKPENPGDKPLSSIDLTDVHITRDEADRRSWSVQGGKLRKPHMFTAENEEEREVWIEKMAHPNPANTEILRTLEQTSDGDDTAPLCSGGSNRVSLNDFQFAAKIGKGSFSSVYAATEKATGKTYAIKKMEKEVIERYNMIDNISAERLILQKIDHPFIVSLHYAFQTKGSLYLVMDFLSGGELFFHLESVSVFDEWRAKFYCGEIALALGYLHAQDIIYRDLKPENAVLDADGHVCLTDFGLAKMDVRDACNFTFCGTPEYIAPEFLLGKPHGKAVDWWSLGILLYEMLEGIPPFYSENVSAMYDKILSSELQFGDGEGGSNNMPQISEEAQDLLRRLLDRNPDTRLQDVEELKGHPFFRDLDWEKLFRREIEPPFRPDGNALSNFDQEFTSADPPMVQPDDEVVEDKSICGFTFNGRSRPT